LSYVQPEKEIEMDEIKVSISGYFEVTCKLSQSLLINSLAEEKNTHKRLTKDYIFFLFVNPKSGGLKG